MKLLHAADLHLDSAFTGRSPEAVGYLKKALLSVPEQLARLCREHRCDLMLLAGDIFDGSATRESVQAMKKALQEAGVPVLISPGNHDFCGPNSPWLGEIWPENVHIFTQPSIQSLAFPELDCRIYGAGFTAMDCPGLLENFRAEGSERYQIGLLHGDPLQKNAPYCPVTQQQVAASGLDYLAMGHIHKAGQFTAGGTLCAWPGCPMGRGMDELGEKGVYIVTVGDTVSTQWVGLDVPRFYDVEAEVLTTAREAVLSVLPPVPSRDFYRITLTGESQPIDVSQLYSADYPNLELRDRTVLPKDLWQRMGEDSLEGLYFRMLHDLLETEDPETVALAAKISQRILDGQEVVLP